MDKKYEKIYGRTRLVVAGDYHQFMNWLREDEYDGFGAVFVKDFMSLAGRNRETIEIIKIGTWYENEKAVDAVEKWLGMDIRDASQNGEKANPGTE